MALKASANATTCASPPVTEPVVAVADNRLVIEDEVPATVDVEVPVAGLVGVVGVTVVSSIVWQPTKTAVKRSRVLAAMAIVFISYLA